MEEESCDGIGEDNGFDIEREEMRKKSKKNNKTGERKSESEATYQRTSTQKGSTESPVSPLRRSGRSRSWEQCSDK